MPKIIALMAGGGVPNEYEFYSRYIIQAHYTIAVDAGLSVFLYANILPDLWVGDGDSVGKTEWEWAKQKNIPIRQYSSDKSATDTELALDIAISLHPEQIWILGGIGNRMDHTLGNFFLLEYAYQHNVVACLIHPYHIVRILTPQHPLSINGKKDDIVSIIPITEKIIGLTLQGLHWPLQQATLFRGPTVTISNKLEQENAIVQLEQGLAFVIQANEQK